MQAFPAALRTKNIPTTYLYDSPADSRKQKNSKSATNIYIYIYEYIIGITNIAALVGEGVALNHKVNRT